MISPRIRLFVPGIGKACFHLWDVTFATPSIWNILHSDLHKRKSSLLGLNSKESLPTFFLQPDTCKWWPPPQPEYLGWQFPHRAIVLCNCQTEGLLWPQLSFLALPSHFPVLSLCSLRSTPINHLPPIPCLKVYFMATQIKHKDKNCIWPCPSWVC